MARTVDFLPEIFRTPTNRQVLHATLDQLVQEPRYQRAQGFIGQKFGPGVTTEDRYIVEPDQTRRNYQLEPTTIFLEDGSRKIVDALTYPGYLDSLKKLTGPVDRPDELFEQEYYAVDFFIDWDKSVNYNQYYWVFQGPETVRLTAPATLQAFNVEREIVGQQTYTTDQERLLSPTTWNDTVSFSNGMRIQFIGNIKPAEYRGQEFYVEGVGTKEGIKLLPVDNFVIPEIYNFPVTVKREPIPWDIYPWDTTLWDGSRLVPGSDIDYVTINRASQDLNAWTRSNRWFHIDVLTYSAEINGMMPVVDDNFRGKRPILEFRPDLKLIRFGTQGLQPISLIDYSVTNAFQQVAGQTSFSIDGIQLFAGMKVIFAADENPAVARQVYLVEQITPVPGGQSVLYLQAIEGQVAQEGSVTVCTLGVSQQGYSFYYSNGQWSTIQQTQQKTHPNQAPLFDVFDQQGISFSNTTIYPDTTFVGSPLFSYAVGTGVADAVLRFPLQYSGLNNVGDILFHFNLYRDSFSYLNNRVIEKVGLRTGFVHQYSTRTSYTRLIGYQTASLTPNTTNTPVLSQQPQLFEFDYSSGNLRIDVAVLEQSQYPNITNIVRVSVNDVLQDPGSYSYRILDANNLEVYPEPQTGAGAGIQTEIIFNEDPLPSSLILVAVLSSQTSKIGYFAVPTNLTINALNQDLTECTLGTLRDHYVSICQNISGFTGEVLAANNSRDLGNLVPYGTNLLQHSAALAIPAVFLRQQDYAISSALDYSAIEYQRYKDLLLDFVWKNEFLNETTAQILDSAIDALKANRSSDNPFYWSDVITAGIFESTDHVWYEESNTTFDLIYTYDYSKANYQGLNVYVDNVILCRDKDYIVDTITNTVTVELSALTDGCTVTIREYQQTYGNFVPATPTSLRLFPAYFPEIFLDTTYTVPTTVIRGHDGSITPAFGDYRDQVLLEFETRIYSNIKGTADYPLDYNQFLPGAFRGVTADNINAQSLLNNEFVRWLGSNRVDYKQQDFVVTNEKTWNFSQTGAKITYPEGLDQGDAIPMPGYWRQIYWLFYDTDEPQNFPWQMLGFSNRPDWWETVYGPAPYTSGNVFMWEDIANGYIREPGNPRIDPVYKRPGLLDVLPVDAQGNLLLPFQSVVADYNPATYQANWSIGGGSPAESAWRKSSAWPFAIQKLLLLLKPAQYLNYYIDRDLYKFNTEFNQWLYDGRQRLTAEDVQIYGSGTAVNSYVNFVIDYNKSYGLPGTETLEARIKNLDVRLAYRVAGFTDKRYLQLLSDRSSPNTYNRSLLIPDENYNILLYRNEVFASINYSAVTIERTESGWAVYGNSIANPYFQILPSIINNNYTTLRIGNTTIRMQKDFSDTVTLIPYGYIFRSINAVVDFLLSYGKFLNTSGFAYNSVENTVLLNWEQMAQEFVYWYNQGWSVGALIQLNPSSSKLEFYRQNAVVVNLLEAKREDVLVNQNKQALRIRDYSVYRDGNLFELTALNENTIGYVNLKLTNYEHIIIVDNITDFDDLIYQPLTGLRQGRLIYQGIKSAEWDGTMDAPGFIINLPSVAEWDPGLKYAKGQVVKFKNFYYQANITVDPADTFDYNLWDKIVYRPDQEGMLPNLALKAIQSTQFYDQHADNLNADSELLGFGLTGFRPREYMASIELDTVSQMNVYQDFIGVKGTPRSLYYFDQAVINGDELSYDIYENWAIQRATYGATATNAFIDFTLDATVLTSNPSTAQFTVLEEQSEADQSVPITSIYATSQPVNTTEILPLLTQTSVDKFLPTAGYVDSRDVEIQLFSIQDLNSLSAELDKVTNLAEVWIAKVNEADWNVYKCQNLPVTLVLAQDNLDGQTLLIFSDNHGLVQDQTIIIKEFNVDLQGAFVVASVPSTSTVLITQALPDGVTTLVGQGIVFELSTVRVPQPSSIADLAILFDLSPTNKIWVDNNGSGRWLVLEKQNPFTNFDAYEYEGTELYGSAVCQTTDNGNILIGAPGSYNSGAIIPYYLDGNVYVPESPIVTPSLWTNYSDFGRVGDSTGEHWAAFSVGLGTVPGFNTDFRVVIMQKTSRGFEPRQLLPGGSTGVNGYFTGDIKFSEDSNWLYVSNPVDRKVQAYQKNQYQEQAIKFICNGSQFNFEINDTIRVDRGAQFAVSLNATLQAYNQDYTATPNRISTRVPPAGPVTSTVAATTAGTNSFVVNSLSGIALAQQVSGIGIPAESVITNINTSTNTVTLDTNITVSATNVDITFTNVLYVSRWSTQPDSGYWGFGANPLIPSGITRSFPIDMLAGATPDPQSVAVYYYGELLRYNNFPAVDGDYIYDFANRRVVLNFTPPRTSSQAITYMAQDYFTPVTDIINFSGDTFGISCATDNDGTILAVGDADANSSNLGNDRDGVTYIYDRGTVAHKVSNANVTVYNTPTAIVGLPQVRLNGQLLSIDTEMNFGQYYYDLDPTDPNYTGNTAVQFKDNVIGNVGDIIEISYNKMTVTQRITNPQANIGNSEFGGAVSLDRTGSSVLVGAPNGNTAVLASGFVARIEDQAAVYGSIIGNIVNPTVTAGSSLRLNNYFVEFASANIASVSLSNVCSITTDQPHGFYNGETVIIDNLNGGVLNLSNKPYYVRVTGSTTFNIFDQGTVSNVSASSKVVVTSNVAANLDLGLAIQVFNPVEISGVQGMANVNNTTSNPYWLARKANGTSNTQFELFRGVPIYNILSVTEGNVAQTMIVTSVNSLVTTGTSVVLESNSASTLNNNVYYAGNIANYSFGGSSFNSFVLYSDPALIFPVNPAGNTGPGGTVGVFVNGTGWGNYASGGQILRYIDTSGLTPAYDANTTQGTAFDGTINGVVNIINNQNITNVIASNSAGKLSLAVVNQSATLPNRKLLLAPGTETSYETGAMYQLGLYPYYGGGSQIISGSYPAFGSRFGSKIDQDWDTYQTVISSEFGTAAAETTFDLDTTTFDARTTRFDDLYTKSGSVDVFDLLNSDNPAPNNPSKLVWDRQLVDSLVRPGAMFGHSVNIVGNNILVGSPGFLVSNVEQGRALVFSGRRTGWKQIRLQPNEVDIHLLNEVTIYNKESKITLNYLDFIDPIQGRILGAAQQNIDLISATDPAGFNVGDVNNIGVNWGETQYGYIWWDITNVRFLEYHLEDINQSAKIWGGIFPGSSVDVYQWIESPVPPADYTGPGTPRSLTSYSVYDVVTDTNSITTKYYFWVSGLEGVPPYTNKTLSCAAIVQYILNPRSSGISYLAAINPSTVAIYNSNSDFVAQNNVLHISYDTVPQDNNIHVEYDLIQQDNPRQFMDDTTYAKFLDSLSGIDAMGNTVPDPNLPPGLLYGVQFNPRQSMFKDRFLALKNYITQANQILMTFPFVEESKMDLLNSQELPPKYGETDPQDQLWWNVQVANLTELGYQNISLVPLGYRYLVDADSRYNNFWTIHQVDVDSQGQRTTVVILIQTYNTPQYWSYVNWYAEGFNPLQRPLFTVDFLSQAELTPLPENGVIRVTRNNPIGYELYQNKVIESYRDPETLEWRTVTEFVRVGLENGTVQISDQIYDYSNLVNPERPPKTETRLIVDSINFEILTDSRLILRNQMMGLMFNFILGEQIDCNWLYKTSLIDITHPVRKLLPYRTFKRDNKDFVYGYIEEVKPYHVFIKDFSLVYATVADVYPGDITDFDVPATYNATDGIYISPILENDPDYVIYDKYGIYGVGPYAQFQGYFTATGGSGITVLTVTNLQKGSIYVGANLVGTIVAPRTQVISFLGNNALGQATYSVTGQYSLSTSTGTIEINPIWATLPYRNWYNNYGLYVVDIMITNPGSGYSLPPTITITGITTDGVRATAILAGNGSISSILINNQGGRYLTQPLITIGAPDQDGGTQATAYAVTTSGPVRSFDTTLIYNRMNLRPSFTEWIPGFVYSQGDLTKFSGVVYSSKLDFNQSNQFNFNYWIPVPPEDLEGVDRTYGYYTGAPGQPGLILDQLITGLTYPGVITDRRYLGTWDTSPWSTDPFESDRARLETILNGGSYPLDSATGIIPALANWDVNVYGGAYVDTYSSHAPEELVPGATFDTLDLTVYTIPGQDNTNAGFSSPLNGRIYTGDAIATTYSFQLLIKFPEQVLVFKKLGNGDQLRLQEYIDYTVDWQYHNIELATAPTVNEQIMIIAVGLGGGNQILRYSEVYPTGLASNGNIDVPVQYSQIYSLPVFVNGNALTFNTDYTISAYRPEEPLPDDNDIYPLTRINFVNSIGANSRIDYTVIGQRFQTTSYNYSLPVVLSYTGNSSANTFVVTNSMAGTNPIAAIVEIEGSRLRGPHCVSYTGDGTQVTFAAGWQRDVSPNSLTYENITVYLNDLPVTESTWTSGYTAITDTYDITFDNAPGAGSRVVIAVWAASDYWVDADVGCVHIYSSVFDSSNANVNITTWQETAEQKFLNTVSLGQTIIPIKPELAITTNGRWGAGNNFITVGTDTVGIWNRDGLWFDYAAWGSGVTQGNTNPYPNGTSNSANIAVPSEMLSYGNVLIVMDGQNITVGDLAQGIGIPNGTKVTQVRSFKNRDLQTNWAVAIDRPSLGNGLAWTRQYSNATTPYLQSTLFGLSTGPNILALDDYNNILMSNNATQWTYIDPVALLPLRSVAYGLIGGTGYYVAVGYESNILRSADGIEWTQEGFALPIDTYEFNAVGYGAGIFVIVGNDGVIFSSSDAFNWTQETSGTSEDLISVSFNGSEFVITGTNAMILASNNGSIWTRRYLNYVSSVQITDTGSRYVQPPTVTFQGPFNGSGITALGFSAIEGGVGRIDIANVGQRYGRAPNVVISQSNVTTFSGSTPSGATADAYIDFIGAVTYIGLVNGGSGYNTAPNINFTSSLGGTGANAVATLNANGNITSIALTSGGSGYSTAFGDVQVIITPVGNDVPSIAANAVAAVTGNLFQLNMTATGANYSSYDVGTQSNSTPTVTLTPYTVTGFSSSLTTGNVYQDYVVLNSLSELQIGMNIEFVDFSNIQVYTGNITTIYPGNNSIGVSPPLYYTITPFTPFTARDNGVNAVAVFGEYYEAGVSGIVVTESGSGYATAPTVTIGFPPVGYDVAKANTSIAPVSTSNLNDVNYIGNTWITVGTQSTTLYSQDNITWIPANVSPNNTVTLNTVFGSKISNANVFLTGGLGGNLYISNSIANGWQQISSGTSANISQGAYGNGQYVYVATGGIIGYSNSGANGSWNQATTSTSTTEDLYGVIYSGNTAGDWCAVGSRSTILRTSNVASWQAYNQEWPLNDTEYGYQNSRDTYVLVGDNGTIFRSIGNSSDFVRVDSTIALNIEAVTFGQNKFVAVGSNGAAFVSSDANVWGLYNIGVPVTFRDVHYSGANTGPMAYIAVGDAGEVWRSANGEIWTKILVPTTNNLRCICTAVTGNTVKTVVGGEDGTLLVSVDSFGSSFALICQSGTESFMQTDSNNRTFTTTSATIRATDTSDISVSLNGNALINGVDYAITAMNPNVSITMSDAIGLNNIITITTDMPNWNSVTYGNDKFVLMGQAGTVWNGYVNASVWEQMQALTSANITSVAYGSSINQFVSVGEAAGSQQIGTQSYIATSYTAEYLPLVFVPDFTRIVPGMLVTGDYVRTNTLVTGTDYAQRQVYIDTAQYTSRSNVRVTFTPTMIENYYPVQDPVINGYRPWVTQDGNRLFNNLDYVADGSAVRIVANALPNTAVVQILDSTQNSVPNELNFKVWKDMNDNTAVYRMTSNNITEVSYRVQFTDDIIYVEDATKLTLPQLSLNQIGLAFVGSERLAYRYINYETNTISGLIRGIGGTAPQDHDVGTTVVDAGTTNNIPIAYRDHITAEQFTGDGNTKTFATATVMADIQEEIRLAVAGTEIPMRMAKIPADGISTVFTATDANVSGNTIGTIFVDTYDQVLVGLDNTLLPRPNSNIFYGDNFTNVFIANNVVVSNVANVVVVVNHEVIVPNNITLIGNNPNVVIDPAPNGNSWIQISETYAVIETEPVQVAFAQTPAANSIITIAADYYAVGVKPAVITLAEPPANGVTVVVGIDSSRSWYNAIGDGVRLQSQPTVAGRFLQGDV
jgi:hypothetical protein